MVALLPASTRLPSDLETPPAVVQWEEGAQKLKGALRMAATTGAVTSIMVDGVNIEMIDRGQDSGRARPILFLHPSIGIDPTASVIEALGKGGRVIAPTHPGFGNSQ